MVERKYNKLLRDLAAQFPIIVLTGARQVGKTSLVRKIFPEFSYCSLDLPAQAEMAERNSQHFLKEHEEPLIIDEVQYAPALFRHLKLVVDQDKSPGRFILTGSQNFLLMRGVSESLAGRCAIVQMHNLSAKELLESEISFSENDYLTQGGFPELYARPGIEAHFWQSAYVSTYLERDVRNILHVGNLRDFDRFLRAVAIRTGQILSYSDLARDVGIAPQYGKTVDFGTSGFRPDSPS